MFYQFFHQITKKNFSKRIYAAALILFAFSAYAQETNDSLNATQKAVMQEARKSVASKDTLNSILMISGVIIIVFIALWLSFKSSGGKKKKEIMEKHK